MTIKKAIGTIALMLAFVAVALSATVIPTPALAQNRGRGGGHGEIHGNARGIGRGYNHAWRGDYYPPHRGYYGYQRGYYPPSPPVVLMPPPMFPGFNIIIPLGR